MTLRQTSRVRHRESVAPGLPIIPSTLRTRCVWVIALGTLAFALLAWHLSAIIVFAHTRWLHLLIGLGCTMVMLTAFSRVYLDAHYLSDVIAGVCVGLVWVHGCQLLLDGSLRD